MFSLGWYAGIMATDAVERAKRREEMRKLRIREKLQVFGTKAVVRAKKNVIQMLESNDNDERWKASTFVLEQMYGKAAAKPLEKPANPKDDKLQKLMASVMARQTVNETNSDSEKPN